MRTITIIFIFLCQMCVAQTNVFFSNTNKAQPKQEGKVTVSASESDVFTNAAGAAFGGFLGVVFLVLIKWYVEHIKSKPKVIKTYFCANNVNIGQAEEVDGEIKHHHGKRIGDRESLDQFEIDHPVWEWTRERTQGNPMSEGGSIFYGPYATDLTEPGLYLVTFRIRGLAFTKPREVIGDNNLLRLDVNCILPEIVGASQGIGYVPKPEDAALRYVRVSELAKEGWQEFDLQVWSQGRGTWEYRAWAFDGAGRKPDNFATLDQRVRILFDRITIKKIARFELPAV